ncbi:MAG: hypothetical protein LBU65_02315, partial [Planctomycetaceae bacterium]|nr:hypothetical protein [Planctomycetaceae bacterium]
MKPECESQNTCVSVCCVDVNQRWVLMRFTVAMIILIAAGLKFQQLITVPLLGEGLLNARWFNVLVVGFELFFGTWLIFGMLPKLTWLASVGLFSVFSSVSLYKAISGETSCGCFGAVTVNPWVTSVFDIFIVGLLIVFRPIEIRFRWNVLKTFYQELLEFRQYRRFVIGVVAWLAVALPVTYVVMNVDFVSLSGNTKLSGNEKSVTLEPANWLGKKFPLLEYIDFENDFDSDEVKTGEWFVLLYRHDCLECQAVLAKIENQTLDNNTGKMLMIEVPGNADQKHRKFNRDNIMWGSLRRGHEW